MFDKASGNCSSTSCYRSIIAAIESDLSRHFLSIVPKAITPQRETMAIVMDL
jgi:hypothetical protein